ncbi:hypothetical protein C8R43DRAFT_960345 [Mycena crocata]|nr:hypothetical protein C8R43DRAFT_960345 [Mycena crocata]
MRVGSEEEERMRVGTETARGLLERVRPFMLGSRQDGVCEFCAQDGVYEYWVQDGIYEYWVQDTLKEKEMLQSSWKKEDASNTLDFGALRRRVNRRLGTTRRDAIFGVPSRGVGCLQFNLQWSLSRSYRKASHSYRTADAHAWLDRPSERSVVCIAWRYLTTSETRNKEMARAGWARERDESKVKKVDKSTRLNTEWNNTANTAQITRLKNAVLERLGVVIDR